MRRKECWRTSAEPSNIVSAAHCATRLRLVIADNEKCRKEALEEVEGVKGVFEASGQIQIIFGTGTVNKVFEEFVSLAGIKAGTEGRSEAGGCFQAKSFSPCHQDAGRYLCSHHTGDCRQRAAHGAAGRAQQYLAVPGGFRNLSDFPSVQQYGVCISAGSDCGQRGEGLRRQPVPGRRHSE